jgi:anti-anti-sigma factor
LRWNKSAVPRWDSVVPLTLRTHYLGDVFVVQCNGRIVAGDELRSLDAALDLAAREFRHIVLSAEKVDRLDSSGFGLLARYLVRIRKRGGDLRFATLPQSLRELFKLTTLNRITEAYETEKDAVMSFALRPAGSVAANSNGAHVLVLDEEGDVCVFLTTLLQLQGFRATSVACLPDARILLEAEPVAYIVIGPNGPKLPPEQLLQSLRAWAPQAIALQLGADFSSLTAMEAAEWFLQLIPSMKKPSRLAEVPS